MSSKRDSAFHDKMRFALAHCGCDECEDRRDSIRREDKELIELRKFKVQAKQIAENLFWRADEGLTVRLLMGEQNAE